MKIKTYKHNWNYNLSNGVTTIKSRKKYPLSFLSFFSKKFNILSRNKEIEKDPSIIYEYFVSKKDISVQTDRANAFSNILKRYGIDFNGKTILDISGGNGVFVKQFLKFGAKSVTNTEYSKDAVNFSKKTLKINSFEYDINVDKLSSVLKNEKFDIIMLRGCIEFCEDLIPLTKELKLISHQNSIIIFSFIIPTLGAALRTQFDQYNVKVCRPAKFIEQHFSKNDFETKINSEIFLFDRNYAYQKLKWPYTPFYIYYLILALFKVHKNNYPNDFHSLDCKTGLLILNRS